MHQNSRVTLTRLALVVSALSTAGIVACSDASTAPRLGNALSASADKGSGKTAQSGNQGGNQGPGNAQDTARIELEVRLMKPATAAPDSAAEGNAKFEVNQGRMKFSIEAEHLVPGDTVSFFVGATQVGTGVVGALGEAEFSLDSQHGDTVPAIVATTTVAGVTTAGTAVSVKNAAGAVILSGSF